MPPTTEPHRYEIRFPSLINCTQALVFPCNAQGHVNMDALSARSVADYLFARATIGHDYGRPRVIAVD